MKRIIWLLIFAVLLPVGYKIAPALAQGDIETLTTEKVVEDYLNSFIQQDINSAMDKVSLNYYAKDKDGNVWDYKKFKSSLEDTRAILFKKFTDYSITKIKITKTQIKDSNATLWVSYNWKGFNLNKAKDETGKINRVFYLTKEGDSWKITKIVTVRNNLKKALQKSL